MSKLCLSGLIVYLRLPGTHLYHAQNEILIFDCVFVCLFVCLFFISHGRYTGGLRGTKAGGGVPKSLYFLFYFIFLSSYLFMWGQEEHFLTGQLKTKYFTIYPSLYMSFLCMLSYTCTHPIFQ